MTSSTRFWKRHNTATDALVTLSTSCAIEPPRQEPIQIRLRGDDHGPLDGKHLILTMTTGEAESLIAHLRRHIDRLSSLEKS